MKNGDSITDSIKALNNSIEDNSIVYFLDKDSNLNVVSKVYVAAGRGHTMHLFVVE